MKNEESSSGLIHALSFRLKNLNRFSIVALLGSIILFFTLEWILRSIEITKEAYPPKIVVTATFNEDDAFTVYYMPNSESQYSDEQSVSHYIRSKKKEQSFVFNLPDSRLIKKIRFDLGRNEMQKEIEIKQVYLSYDNRDLILFDAKTGVNLFHVDHGVTLHKKGRFVLDPPNNSYYDPYLYTDDISAQYSSMLGRKVGLPFHTLVSFICTLSLLLYVLLFQQRLRLRTIFYSFASCFFVAILLFPFIIEFFNLSSGENLEKRALAEKPVLNKNNLVAYPKLYENYYNDNFGFRNELVKLGAKIKYNIFGSSSIPSKASIGKDGWIFLSGSFYHVTEDLQRSNLFTKHTLDSTLNNWIQKKSELEKDSIQFYKAVWPDKHYIYPEFMPRIMTILKKDTLAKCDQLIRYIQETKTNLKLIDVREELLAEKKKTQVYKKYDSHWNSYGAFIGYTALMNEMRKDIPSLKPLQLSDFNITWEDEGAGDLSILLGLNLKENSPVFKLKNDSSLSITLPTDGFPANTYIVQNDHASTQLTALIYRDSFSWALIPFLQHHFKKMVLLSNAVYSAEMVKKVKPDVVIECYATRYFR